MASAASASIAAMQPREAPKPPTLQTAPLPAPAPIAVPAKPAVAVGDPANVQQEQWIAEQLDPTNAAWVGNKYKPAIMDAGASLKSGVQGLGAYDWTEGSMGEVTQTEREGVGQSVPDQYRRQTLDALAAANARGMQSSRIADEAVGIVWSRLNAQKRDFFTRYATTVSSSLNAMQTEVSGLTTSLMDLYGKDWDYSVAHPVGVEDDATSTAAAGTDESTTPTQAPGAPKAPILWHGKKKPKMKTIAKRHALPAKQLQRKTRGGGKGYVVVKR